MDSPTLSSQLRQKDTARGEPTILAASKAPDNKPVNALPPPAAGDTISPPPASETSLGSSIINGVQYSIGNLSGWVSYIAKNSAARMFPSAPTRINRESFLALINDDKKTPLEKMAALNVIVCYGADYPDYQKDVVGLIEEISKKMPAEFGRFCTHMQIPAPGIPVVDFPSLLALITTDAPSTFTMMKNAMVAYYCAPFQSALNKLTTIIHVADKVEAFCVLLESKELEETLKVLDKQPIAKEVILKIVSDSIPHLKDAGYFMVQFDSRLPEDERSGLYAISTAKPTILSDLFTNWVNSDSFSFNALKKYSRESEINLFEKMSSSQNGTLDQKLYTLNVGLSRIASNRMGDLIIAFTQKKENDVIIEINTQEFEALVQAMIALDDPRNPTLPAGTNTKDQIKNWLLSKEKFGTEEKDGKKVKVDGYAPKIALLQKGIQEVRAKNQQKLKVAEDAKNLRNAIDAKNTFISEVRASQRTARGICEGLLEASSDPALPQAGLIEMFNVVADEFPKVFSKIAKSIIDKQAMSTNQTFASLAQRLQQNVNNNENSAVSHANDIRSRQFQITSMIFGDPLDYLKDTGQDEGMDDKARLIEFKKYVNHQNFNKEFVATGLAIHLA